MKLILSSNDGEVVNIWEDIESNFLPTVKGHTLRPYFLIDEIRALITRMKSNGAIKFGVVSITDEDFGHTYEEMRELKGDNS